MSRLIPTDEQQAAIDRMVADESAGALVGADTGTGKTVMSAETIIGRWASRALIAAPLSTYETWRDTLYNQGGIPLLPAANQRIAPDFPLKTYKANLEALIAGERGVYFVNREHFVSLDWYTSKTRIVDGKKRITRSRTKVWEKHPFDVLCFDEAHLGADRKSRAAKTFREPIADYKIALSATWFANKFENAWTLPHAIWGDSPPPEGVDTFELWRARYCETSYDPFTYDHVKVEGELNEGAFVKTLPTYIYLASDIQKPVPDVAWVTLSRAERKVYDDIDRAYAAELGDNMLVVDIPITARLRMRQATLGTLQMDGDEVTFDPKGHSSKYQEILRLLREDDEPVLIATHSAKYAKVLTQWLNDDKITAGLWAGKKHTSGVERSRLKKSFIDGETRVIVMVIAAAGTGTDGLQKICRTMIVASEDESAMNREQLFGRLARTGQKRPVRIHLVQARSTLDAGVEHTLTWRAISNRKSRTIGS